MISSKRLTELKERSIQVIREGQKESGAYIAGPTFTPYQFSWFRDGAFIADAMSRVGEVESAEAFFDWATRVVLPRREKILSGEILHTRYTSEGVESDQEWPNFQLDGFGALIWAIHEHEYRHRRSEKRWDETIQILAEYLTRRWREPSYDWWEEYADLHPATLASIYAGLKIVHHPEAEAVQQAINLEKAKLDASLIVCATPFRAVTPEAFAPTLVEIEANLVTPHGGVHRHLTDVYYGGGEWLLLTCFLGWHYVKIGRTAEARQKLERVTALMDENGWLPEQIEEHLLAPAHYQAWVKKWGPSARPLLWSHAMFLTLGSVLESS